MSSLFQFHDDPKTIIGSIDKGGGNFIFLFHFILLKYENKVLCFMSTKVGVSSVNYRVQLMNRPS